LNKQPLSLRDRLVRLLIEKKLVTRDNIDKAIEQQKRKGGKLSDILVRSGFVSKKDVTAILCQELGLPAIDLGRFKISPEIISLIPKKTAKQYQIIPVSKMGSVLTVAMADPLNVFAMDDIKAITGCEIGPVISNERDMSNAIAEYYDGVSHESLEEVVEGIGGQADVSVLEDALRSEESEDLLKMTQDAPVVQVTNYLLAESVKLRASDVLVEPLENELRIRYRVDGILVEGKRPPKRIHNAIISRLKVMADLNIAEKRLPQDGRFKVRIQNREVDFRVSILPSNIGEKAALRVLDKAQATLDLDALGFEKESLEGIKKMAQRPHGMILVCGPTGCGKTTTLYSVLKFIDSPDKNIISVEDPVEYQLFGINQVSVKPEIGLTFAGSLRSILRQDPDVIMIGEIRDYKTVDIAIKAALTGHLVLSTLHTTTASGSIVRLIDMGVEPFLITSSVLVVAAQRLVRRICNKCKEHYKLDKETARRLGLEPGTEVFHGKGCKHCKEMGYKGRVGILETLVLTPPIRQLILDRAQDHIINAAARKEGMKSLRMNAIKKVIAGLTTVEEVMRVTMGEQDIPVNEK